MINQRGLGTGSTAWLLNIKGLSIDVIEIDPSVIESAVSYFGFKESDYNQVINADAYQTVVSGELDGRVYDIIVHDLFSAALDSRKLLTKQYFEKLKLLLSPRGKLIFVRKFCKLILDICNWRKYQKNSDFDILNSKICI